MHGIDIIFKLRYIFNLFFHIDLRVNRSYDTAVHVNVVEIVRKLYDTTHFA